MYVVQKTVQFILLSEFAKSCAETHWCNWDSRTTPVCVFMHLRTWVWPRVKWNFFVTWNNNNKDYNHTFGLRLGKLSK